MHTSTTCTHPCLVQIPTGAGEDIDEALYETIYKTLLAEIQAGTYADGKRLPTEAQLSQRFFVSRITSKRALNKLPSRGWSCAFRGAART